MVLKRKDVGLVDEDLVVRIVVVVGGLIVLIIGGLSKRTETVV